MSTCEVPDCILCRLVTREPHSLTADEMMEDWID